MGGESAEITLGKRLQQARQQAGLTQQEMCQKTGMSYSTLAKIERGAIKSPSIFTIQNIATVLGVGMEELIGTNAVVSAHIAKKSSKSGVRFVYFDINGCLVRFFHGAFSKLAHDSGVRSDVIETAFWHYNDAVCRGEMSIEDFNLTLAERLGMKSLNWADYYIDAVDPIEEMREVVSWAAEHYYVGLLSNIMPGLISSMRSQKILPDVEYRSIIDSSEVKTIKPEQQIYEIAQQRSGVPAEEILLVDDARANLMAAEKMGWHVLWFDDYRPEESAYRVREALEFDA